jgi:pyruvate/2-oxoglutarate/acetoin dehydrogenase E1 component
MPSYFKNLKSTMSILAKKKNIIFLGQAVEYPGTAIYNTLAKIKKNKLIELPVAEEMQMGMTIGLMMEGYTPVSIFPRYNFLLLAINQLVNHLDKFNEMTGNPNKRKAIIRTSIGSKYPLNPQSQHLGDFTSQIKSMCKSINVVKLKNSEMIKKEYLKAYNRTDGISSIIIEYGDYYNKK